MPTDRADGADDLDRRVELNHWQAPAGGGDGVAFASVGSSVIA